MSGSTRSLSERRRERWKIKGVDPLAAEAALAEHDGHCDCCGSTSPGSVWGWHIDFDHKLAPMAPVRGVLCHQCNIGLGMFGDDPYRLRMAIAFLGRSSAGPDECDCSYYADGCPHEVYPR